jgi:hypothetical protein
MTQSEMPMTTNYNRQVSSTAVLFAILLTQTPSTLFADVPVTLTRVGDPIWRPVDFHLFTAPAEPFEEVFVDFVDSLFFPQPTVPPYDNFLADRLAATGIQVATVFDPADIAGEPSGVYLMYTLVPDPGTTGSSFAAGPIIPNRLFPFTYDHDLFRNGVIVDPLAYDDVSPPEAGFDGKAYESIFIVEDALYFPPGTQLAGNYEYRGVLRDREGNGWNITAPFQVVPEPRTIALSLILLLSAPVDAFRGVRARRQRGMEREMSVFGRSVQRAAIPLEEANCKRANLTGSAV